MNAREIVEALGERWRGTYGNVRCPAHNDRNPSLTIRPGDNGKPLVHCHAGCEQSAIISALKARGLWNGSTAPADRSGNMPTCGHNARSDDSAKNVEKARAIWRASRPIAGTLGETYFRGRGIACTLPATLRFHPALKHCPTGQELPAVVAAVAVWPSRRIVGIHRTFLDHRARKASVADPKMSLGTLRGGAVRLRGHNPGKLILAEGIETALSVCDHMNASLWACLSAGGLEGVMVPHGCDIIIAADADDRGRQAADKTCERLRREGHAVRIVYPPEPHKDFNDALQGGAL